MPGRREALVDACVNVFTRCFLLGMLPAPVYEYTLPLAPGALRLGPALPWLLYPSRTYESVLLLH